jgi:NADPH-dependent 2,4-dienoyl-CoA reductase/sulfur reductase-like enzyme
MSPTQRIFVVGADGMSAAHQALRSAVAAGLGIGEHDGYLPDEQQRIGDRVWAAGDCCEVIDRIRAKHVFAPLGTHANKQGGVRGHNPCRRPPNIRATAKISADVHSRGTTSPARNQGGKQKWQ